MKRYDYLIVGGGMTAAAAVRGIREVDPNGSIGIIGMERRQPYKRPPLTKKLWWGKPEDIIWEDFPREGLDLIHGCRVTGLDPQNKQAQDDLGRGYAYGKLLLATGGTPRHLPFAPPETVYYRTLDDYHTVRGWTGHGARIGIIGGGFIGSELAASLAMNKEKAVMVFPEASLGDRIYPADLSQYLMQYYRDRGVEIHPEMEIESVGRDGETYILHGKDGKQVPVDHVVAGIGIRPNIDLAQEAAIKIGSREEGGGILVDERLRASRPDIYAAGDVASFFNPALGKILRVEHENNANSMGRAAGLNMAGRETPYEYLPYFYSDLFDLGYEAIGELDSRLETVSDWEEPFRKGVVYYLKEGVIRGVLLWNTWNEVDAARELIAERARYRPGVLAAQVK